MNESAPAIIGELTRQAQAVMRGDYAGTERMTALTRTDTTTPALAELAESIAMMAVKVEARELAWQQQVQELQEQRAALEREGRLRQQASLLFVQLCLFVGGYNALLAVLNSARYQQAFAHAYDPVITLGICGVFIMLCAAVIRQSGARLSAFGVTMVNAGRAIRESLLATAALAAVLLAAKWWAIGHTVLFKGASLLNWSVVDWVFFSYLFVAPVQEFMTRGVFQGTIARILTGPRRGWWAIMVTATIFGALHTYYSLTLAVTAFLSSLLLGWLYQRHANVIGISLAHFLIGNLMVLLEFWPLIAA